MELVIHTFGTSVSRDGNGFVITNQQGRKRLPADGLRSIQIGKGVQITSDAILLAIEYEIEVLFIERSGKPAGRVWSPKYGSISTIRKGQLAFVSSPQATDWVKDVICKKILNQQALLLTMRIADSSEKHEVDKVISRLEEYIRKVHLLEGTYVSDVASTLRGWEGVSSRIYFNAMNYFIPEAYRFECRSQHPALDMTNAFLNYGYGVLYGKIEAELIKAGIDPYIGIMHRDEYNRPVLVYDVIELYRVWVDYVVYTLLAQGLATDEFYSVRQDGSYWLEALGRRVLIQSINDYLDEIVEEKGLQRSRKSHLTLYAQQLAKIFKSHDSL